MTDKSARNFPRLSMEFCLSLILGAVLVATGAFLILETRDVLRRQAMAEAESKARLLLDHNLAIHTYFTHQLKPNLFEYTEPLRDDDVFMGEWMSSTYAVREIEAYAHELADGEAYYYKECAINARSPKNEADGYEREFLRRLNQDPDLVLETSVRRLQGEPFLVFLRRGETMQESCLRCHSSPEEAPAQMVEAYGPERSFGRHEGEVVSAISIRVPLSSAFSLADRLSSQLFRVFALALLVTFLLLGVTYRRLFGNHLKRIHRKALEIAHDDSLLGDQLPVPWVREMNSLCQAFNLMSSRLKDHVSGLEGLVKKRTASLARSNENLEQEVAERRKAEEEKEKTIQKLEQALKEIGDLREIVPVCLHCKSVRDDKGYWMQVDRYVEEQMHSRISHGICPDCLKKHYSDLLQDEDGEADAPKR